MMKRVLTRVAVAVLVTIVLGILSRFAFYIFEVRL